MSDANSRTEAATRQRLEIFAMEEANENAYQRQKGVLDARYTDVLSLVDRPVKHRLRRDFFRVEVPLNSVICGTVIKRGQYTIPFSFSLP